jgi:chromosome segregation ATPase
MDPLLRVRPQTKAMLPQNPNPMVKSLLLLELTLDRFDELIFQLSFAILQLVQHIETGDAAQLHTAVTDAQQAIRDHYIAVSERMNDAIHYRSGLGVTAEESHLPHQGLMVGMEAHKAEADRLRLSLHDQSDTLAEAIRQRDEALQTKNGLKRELAEEKKQRGEENEELRAFKREVDRLNAVVLQTATANQVATRKVEKALKDVETANRHRAAAIQVVDKVTGERDVANAVRDAAKLDRDMVRDEKDMAVRDKGILLRRLEELERQQLAVEKQQVAVEEQQVAVGRQRVVDDGESEKAKVRREAFEALTSKYNEKKRKVSGVQPDL